MEKIYKVKMTTEELESIPHQDTFIYPRFFGESGEEIVIESTNGDTFFAEIHDSHSNWQEGGEPSYTMMEIK